MICLDIGLLRFWNVRKCLTFWLCQFVLVNALYSHCWISNFLWICRHSSEGIGWARDWGWFLCFLHGNHVCLQMHTVTLWSTTIIHLGLWKCNSMLISTRVFLHSEEICFSGQEMTRAPRVPYVLLHTPKTNITHDTTQSLPGHSCHRSQGRSLVILWEGLAWNAGRVAILWMTGGELAISVINVWNISMRHGITNAKVRLNYRKLRQAKLIHIRRLRDHSTIVNWGFSAPWWRWCGHG